MINQRAGLPKWPFFLGDVILVVVAYLVMSQAHRPMTFGETILVVICAALGAVLGVLPFVLESLAAMKQGQSGALEAAAARIQGVEQVAAQISNATAQWQGVQEQAVKTTEVAKRISERMGVEAKAFTDFLTKAQDSERANLRLEVEKLKRAEGDWLQVVVRTLDHVYALNQAGARSGQEGLIEQLGNFQTACRDVARRIGLVPFAPTMDEAFDSQWHQLADPQAVAGEKSVVQDTIATGYTYQGQLVRHALVTLKTEIAVTTPDPEPEPEPEAEVEEEIKVVEELAEAKDGEDFEEPRLL